MSTPRLSSPTRPGHTRPPTPASSRPGTQWVPSKRHHLRQRADATQPVLQRFCVHSHPRRRCDPPPGHVASARPRRPYVLEWCSPQPGWAGPMAAEPRQGVQATGKGPHPVIDSATCRFPQPHRRIELQPIALRCTNPTEDDALRAKRGPPIAQARTSGRADLLPQDCIRWEPTG